MDKNLFCEVDRYLYYYIVVYTVLFRIMVLFFNIQYIGTQNYIIYFYVTIIIIKF